MERSEVLGSVELTPYLIRSAATDAVDGFGALPGARLASARSWEIRVDRLRSPIGAYLDIRYVSFTEQGAIAFRLSSFLAL